jgi:transposase InsO family protein
MSRSGNVWDNAAMESFFSSLKTERTAPKVYRSRDEAKARCSTTSTEAPAHDDWISKLREAGWTSLSGCQPNRVQAPQAEELRRVKFHHAGVKKAPHCRETFARSNSPSGDSI